MSKPIFGGDPFKWLLIKRFGRWQLHPPVDGFHTRRFFNSFEEARTSMVDQTWMDD